MKKYLLIAIAALLLLAALQQLAIRSYQRENKVLVNNNKSLTQQVTRYKARDGKEVAKSIVMQSTARNLTDQQLAVVKNLKVKTKHLNDIGRITTKIDTTATAAVTVTAARDTCYNFTINKEFKASVCIKRDSAALHVEVTDTTQLVFAEERVFVNKRKAFFLARWLQRRQTVVTVNVLHSNDAIRTTTQTFTHIVK